MEKTELLACRDVSLGYGGRPLLEHLNLSVRAGDYLCVVGENGSGKSTLMKCLLGLLEPMAGQIVRTPELRRGALGYLPQQTQAQRDFPRHGGRGGALRLSQPAGHAVFLHPPASGPRP
jgi:zinc transport system ATP-binding protein